MNQQRHHSRGETGTIWRSNYAMGIMAITGFILVALVIFNKEELTTRAVALVGGSEPIKAEFSRDYKLREYRAGATVKMVGVQIGTITKVIHTPQGTALVSMQIDPGIRAKLGSAPMAHIRPTLVLGGRYYIDLVPGGAPGKFTGDTIPLSRTTIPVEAENVLEAVGTPAAERGIQSSVKQLDATLAAGGTDAVQQLLDDSPATLQPAGDTLMALRGNRPDDDLTDLVTGLRNTAVGLNHHDGQIASIIASINQTTGALAAGSQPLADAIAQMPQTLQVTRAGLRDLQPTLDQLTVTATNFRDSAEDLGPLMNQLDPVLERTRPLVSRLRPVMDDARPLVEQLVPTTDEASDALDDIRGPVLDRLHGPITHTILSKFHGQAQYQGDGASGNPLYQELGYLVSRGAQDFGWHDINGAHARLSADIGANTVGSSPQQKSLEQYLQGLTGQRPGPRPNSGPLAALPNPGTQRGGSTAHAPLTPAGDTLRGALPGGPDTHSAVPDNTDPILGGVALPTAPGGH